eukprot:c11935_g1_i1 orf=99-251(+)
MFSPCKGLYKTIIYQKRVVPPMGGATCTQFTTSRIHTHRVNNHLPSLILF